MSDNHNQETNPDQPMTYQIRLDGHLGSHWVTFFEDMMLTLEDNGQTVLTGPVVDQAALHGLLRRVSDLGVPLVSVNRLDTDQSDAPDSHVSE